MHAEWDPGKGPERQWKMPIPKGKEQVPEDLLSLYLSLVEQLGALELALANPDIALDNPGDVRETRDETANAIYLMRQKWDI